MRASGACHSRRVVHTLQRRLGLDCREHLRRRRSASCRRARWATSSSSSALRSRPAGSRRAVPLDRPDGPHARAGVMATGKRPAGHDAMVGRAGVLGRPLRRRAPRLKFLPLRSIVADVSATALLVAGDAAGLAKPTTGGGIHYSIVSASLACDVAPKPRCARDRLESAALSAHINRGGAGVYRASSMRSGRCASWPEHHDAIARSTRCSSWPFPTA